MGSWNTSAWQRQSCSHLCIMASWTHVHSSRSWNLSKWSYRQLKMELQSVLSVRTLMARWRHQCEADILPVDCLMITPLLVGPILSGKAPMCHVGMGQRVCRKRLLVHMAPTKGTLKRFREFAAATEVQKDGATCARM